MRYKHTHNYNTYTLCTPLPLKKAAVLRYLFLLDDGVNNRQIPLQANPGQSTLVPRLASYSRPSRFAQGAHAPGAYWDGLASLVPSPLPAAIFRPKIKNGGRK